MTGSVNCIKLVFVYIYFFELFEGCLVTISMKGSPVDGLEGVVIRCNTPNKGEYEVHLPNEEVKVFQSHQIIEVSILSFSFFERSEAEGRAELGIGLAKKKRYHDSTRRRRRAPPILYLVKLFSFLSNFLPFSRSFNL